MDEGKKAESRVEMLGMEGWKRTKTEERDHMLISRNVWKGGWECTSDIPNYLHGTSSHPLSTLLHPLCTLDAGNREQRRVHSLIIRSDGNLDLMLLNLSRGGRRRRI